MGFFTKRLLRAFELLMSIVNLKEMNRVYIWTRLIWLGALLLGKHLAGPDATFRSINLVSVQHPLCAPRFTRGHLRKGVETTRNLNHSRALQPQPASCRGPAEGLHFSCLFKTGSYCPLKWCSLPSSLCEVSLCVHFTKVIYHLSWLFPSILNSCLSLMKFGIKSSQSKRVSYLTQISERILLRKAWSWWPKVDGYYMPLTKVLRIPLKITS